MACEPLELQRGDCAADSGLNPHPIPGWFLERKGAGEAGMRVRARARDRAGPCAHAGRSGATRSGNWSSRSGTEDRFGEEDGADSGPGLSAGATRARAWERRLRRGPCWQAGRGELGRALGPS